MIGLFVALAFSLGFLVAVGLGAVMLPDRMSRQLCRVGFWSGLGGGMACGVVGGLIGLVLA